MFTRHVLPKATSRAFGITQSRWLGTASESLRGVSGRPRLSPPTRFSCRQFSFSFAGPRVLDEIIKKDMLESKSGAEISDIWYTYHESRVSNATELLKEQIVFSNCSWLMYGLLCPQDNVHGLVYKGKDGEDILARARSW